ncbi:TolA protein [hydrothermal vent metagenome]|uniref:TolA protein n=1 Tax=hydrothermal vent metagenome TaxID=652676 RepID=A0A1W1CDG9_9ZZZZ
MFNSKTVSGITAVAIYLLLIYSILLFYNVHKQKAKNYVEKNSNRVTVTLVNSDRTILNKSSKVSTPNRPLPKAESVLSPAIVPPPLKRVIPKKPVPKKKIPKKRVVEVKEPTKNTKAKQREARIKKIKKIKEDNERAKQAQIRKEREAKERAKLARIKKDKEAKERAREARIKKDKEAKERARLARIKKDKEAKERARLARVKKDKEAKERARLARIKKDKEAKERARLARIKKDREAKERAKNLFSSVNTHTPSRTTPKESSIRHTSSVADRIKNTHQSGAVSNRNRERGVENAYIAKVKRRLNNWHAQSNYKGQSARIKLVIKSSGHFRFTILNSSSGSLSSGLKEFLNQLNSMGLGTHNRSRPYNINVTFRAK